MYHVVHKQELKVKRGLKTDKRKRRPADNFKWNDADFFLLKKVIAERKAPADGQGKDAFLRKTNKLAYQNWNAGWLGNEWEEGKRKNEKRKVHGSWILPTPDEILSGLKAEHKKILLKENADQPEDYDVKLLIDLHDEMWEKFFIFLSRKDMTSPVTEAKLQDPAEPLVQLLL